MVPAAARIWVRRARRRTTARPVPEPVWSADTSRGVLELRPAQAQALLADLLVGRVACRVDGGTATAECECDVPDDLVADVVDLVVSSVREIVRRVAWFVPVGDAALETTLVAAGFTCEGWAAPPVGDRRPHRQWALLT
ncbi:hypothetical protein DX116_17430 [Aeromicrobium endophyticum]|uniref:Uncharacterized protein n=2 Tax=Aeromicrobium endophyticum TaxID=2292704 RepID=A0A371P4N7_9ACTN|nr:hypothetical protein DX116_17430 [Aeromicrobium endophyticum]